MSSADDYGPETPYVLDLFRRSCLLLLGKNLRFFFAFGIMNFAYLFEKCQDQRQD